LFTKGLPWSLAAAVMAPSRLAALGCLALPLAARLAMAFSFGAYGMKDPLVRSRSWLIPLHDAMELVTWVAALFSNRISWRESKFYVHRGRLIAIGPPAAHVIPAQAGMQAEGDGPPLSRV
jgi:hypothetical protein